MKLIFRDSKILVWLKNEHPLLHSPIPKIHKDPQTPIWSRGDEIHHSVIWGRDQQTRWGERSTHRIPLRFWTGDVKHIHDLKNGFEREGMVGKRYWFLLEDRKTKSLKYQSIETSLSTIPSIDSLNLFVLQFSH